MNEWSRGHVLFIWMFNRLQLNIHCQPFLLALQCSEQVTVMGCRTASEALSQRILSTPDLLWRTIFDSINGAVFPRRDLLLSNRWTLRKEQQWTMWYLTFKERTQVHSRRCQIWSEAALERITHNSIVLFMCGSALLQHDGPAVTERTYQWRIFIHRGLPDISSWIWMRFSPPKGDCKTNKTGVGGNWTLGVCEDSCAANPWWICCEGDAGLSGGCQRRPSSSRVSKPACEGSPGGSKVSETLLHGYKYSVNRKCNK